MTLRIFDTIVNFSLAIYRHVSKYYYKYYVTQSANRFEAVMHRLSLLRIEPADRIVSKTQSSCLASIHV